MSDNAQQHQQQQGHDAVECSPKSLARRIEGCIIRNAWDEERRAQKALFLLNARDRRIAFLEKRVAELEDVAANLHEVSLRHSSRVSTLERDKEAVLDMTQSEKSLRTDKETDDKSVNRDLSNIDSTRDSFDKKLCGDCESSSENQVSVPCLKLSKSSTSNSEKDIFSTPMIDFILEGKKCFPFGVRASKKDQISEKVIKEEDKLIKQLLGVWSESKLRTKNNQKLFDGDKKVSPRIKDAMNNGLIIKDKAVSESNVNKNSASVSKKNNEERLNLPRTSSSVPWIRPKHSSRKQLRGFELKAQRPVEQPAGDGHLTSAAPGPIETGFATDRRRGKREIVDGATRTEKSKVTREQGEALNLQEARLVAIRKIDTETKTTSTQTSAIPLLPNEKTSQVDEVRRNANRSPSSTDLDKRKSSTVWNIDEDPAPQWLIEEALNRGIEHRERWTKDETASNKETEYEAIIFELEEKLTRTQADLEEALRTKSITKEKYRRSLENVKAEARKENEILQDRIVRICTSVLENFGPRAITEDRRNSRQMKSHRRLKCHEKISCKLHRKLRIAVARSNKLKRELATARGALKNKSEKYKSISKCFDRLKQEMETAEGNLNNLISENLALRKSVEDTREWMEHSMGKEHRERSNATHFRGMQKSRELTNLKKKAEEDIATIAQLRNKLLRSESANANKGFLLNSYKSQLADLNKEKKQLASKISGLENEISAVRNSNSQLKAKISVLSIEKGKLLSENEKSKTDVTEKIETKCSKECKETIQQETDSIKAKYEETIKSMKAKLITTETQNIEYSKAIKEFLKKLYNCRSNYEIQKNANEGEASEKEAHETACNILNMTPEELSGFINGKTPNSINSWIVESNRILAKTNFSESLAKFLLKKVMKKVKT